MSATLPESFFVTFMLCEDYRIGPNLGVKLTPARGSYGLGQTLGKLLLSQLKGQSKMIPFRSYQRQTTAVSANLVQQAYEQRIFLP